MPGSQGRNQVMATTVWPDHYRQADIHFRIDSLLNSKNRPTGEYISTLVHELAHLQLASLHDYMLEITPKYMQAQTHDVVESYISEQANLITELLLDGHHDALDKWMK